MLPRSQRSLFERVAHAHTSGTCAAASPWAPACSVQTCSRPAGGLLHRPALPVPSPVLPGCRCIHPSIADDLRAGHDSELLEQTQLVEVLPLLSDRVAREAADDYPGHRALLAGLDLAPFGISVNAIAPGAIRTERTALFDQDPANQHIVAQALGRIPLPRRGEVDEVAAAAVFLASDEASYIRGHTLVVDGGTLLL